MKGKKILITGASSGIGRKTAQIISEEGADIILTGRNKNALEETFSLLKKGKHQIVCADLTNEIERKNIVAACEKTDGVVHCAGIIKPLPIKFIQPKQLEEVFSINTFSPMLLSAELFAAKKISDGCSFVFISSISTSHPYMGGSLYVSSKAALEAFSKSLALEYAQRKIRSNVISPALVKTAIFEETAKSTGEEEIKNYEKQYPLGFGETEDIASCILFLLSDKSKWITGENIKMDGGLTLGSKK